VHRDRVLVPVDVAVGERCGDLQRGRQLPEAVVLEHDVDPVADRGADRLDHADAAAEIFG